MIKVDRLAACVLLITSSVGFVNDKIVCRKFCKFLQPLESIQGPAALTNKNRENYDKIHAVNLIKRSTVRIYRKHN
jgi:hypothetical protein